MKWGVRLNVDMVWIQQDAVPHLPGEWGLDPRSVYAQATLHRPIALCP